MEKHTSYLNAQFNRVTLSERDFLEAQTYILKLKGKRDLVVKRALVESAIVAYARPFSQNQKSSTDKATGQLPVNLKKYFSATEFILHEKIVELRNRAVAHSEFELRPTGRVMATKNGYMTSSKPFDVLSENIDLREFEALCKKLVNYCHVKKFELNDKLGPLNLGQ